MASAMSQLAQIAPLQEANELFPKMRSTLSVTPEKIVHEDGTVSTILVPDKYYLSSDEWELEHFLAIKQFQSQTETKWAKMQKYKIYFPFKQQTLNLEAKFVFHQLIFQDAWSLSATFTTRRSALSRLAKYVNEYRPDIFSFAEMQSEEFVKDYARYLSDLGLEVTYKEKRRKKEKKTETFAIPSQIYNHLQCLLRDIYFDNITTDLWNEDVWFLKYFSRYGIDAPKSSGIRSIVFTGIECSVFRALIKRYLKEKLLAKTIAWGTAHSIAVLAKSFFNFIHNQHPDWTTLNALTRADMIAYLEFQSIHANDESSPHHKKINRKFYPLSTLSQVRSLLEGFQFLEYPEAPNTPAFQLIRRDDTKGYTSHVSKEIKYVPDFVLQQFFDNIATFPEKYIPVVLTMYYTGLRISDALELDFDCLVLLNGQYWIETDIWKTGDVDHRCPITAEFAYLLQKYIDEAKRLSNDDNNPNHYIFVNYRGIRKGEPYSPHSVRAALNTYAENVPIVDEKGNVFHFKNHAFRHTFSVKMINSGADILTVMQLLAHASPKMTMVYAKLLDDTKRQSFEKAIRSGVFTFSSSKGEEIVYNGDIPDSILANLWQQHKLNAVDTPYGTCLQRRNGRCNFASQPPCLTCDNGKPCKDLCVGVFEGDGDKYEILIESTKKMIQMALSHNRTDMVDENKKLLKTLTGIKGVLDGGGTIYGRPERLLQGE